MRRTTLAFAAFALIIIGITASPALARTMIVVDNIEVPPLEYGQQKGLVSVTNTTDALHFVTVIAEVQFTGPGLTPNRNTRNHFYLEPGVSRTIEPIVLVPANYGKAEVSLRVYDVIDTLDALSDRYKVTEESFQLDFPPPATVAEYMKTPINLPPRVEDHPYFDNDLSRLMLVMMNKGIMVEEIAEITGFRLTMVQELFGRLITKGHLVSSGDSLRVAVPIIGVEEAIRAGKLAYDLADSLTQRIAGNLDNCRRVLDSLVAAGAMSADPNLTFSRGAALHHLYPTISALLLWNDLGRQFITRSAPLLIYDNTDLCNALIPTYMYAVQAGPELNGNQFYALSMTAQAYSVTYSDRPPTIICPDDFILRAQRNMKINWAFGEDNKQQRMLFDSLVVKPAMNALSGGADDLLSKTYYELRDISSEFGHRRLGYGQRYWFWNLVATRTLANLVEAGVVQREGSGHYRLEGYRL
jgi:hypothetical protein